MAVASQLIDKWDVGTDILVKSHSPGSCCNAWKLCWGLRVVVGAVGNGVGRGHLSAGEEYQWGKGYHQEPYSGADLSSIEGGDEVGGEDGGGDGPPQQDQKGHQRQPGQQEGAQHQDHNIPTDPSVHGAGGGMVGKNIQRGKSVTELCCILDVGEHLTRLLTFMSSV